ncbi:MAG: hypothetical protein IJP14_03765 [Clostridia bacterium]|nr:hypothetical protein [Clostridia bacterium]
MVFSVIAAAVFATAGLYMITAAKFTVTRRMAWIPLSMAAMELAMCGILAMGEYPILTVILMACRATVLTCCSISMKRDAAMARNRRRRREVWRRVAYDMAAEVQARPALREVKRCA